MKKFIEWLTGAGLADESEILGLSDDEINGIEQARAISLPEDYKDFLRQCGRNAGLFGRDIDIIYPNFLSLNKEFYEIAEEFGIDYRPPANAFFFSAYQGGSFHYFICGSDDSKTYVLNDGDTVPVVVSESFTSFMLDAISSYQDAFFQNPDKSWML
jgi:hypothetical protein